MTLVNVELVTLKLIGQNTAGENFLGNAMDLQSLEDVPVNGLNNQLN